MMVHAGWLIVAVGVGMVWGAGLFAWFLNRRYLNRAGDDAY